MIPSASETIKVLLVDDHPLIREGLRAGLAALKHIHVVGEASSGEEAVDLSKRLRPDVVLLDFRMPGMGGLEVARRLRTQAPRAKVVILTVHGEQEYVRQMIDAGAKGYILKDSSRQDILRAIHAVHAGGTYLSPAVVRSLAGAPMDGAERPRLAQHSKLSPRETEVLALVADGHSNKEIARSLGISVRTSESHRQRIMDKLGIRTTAGLTKYAIAQGLVKIK